MVVFLPYKNHMMKLLEVMDVFISQIVVMVSPTYAYVQAHQVVSIKYGFYLSMLSSKAVKPCLLSSASLGCVSTALVF